MTTEFELVTRSDDKTPHVQTMSSGFSWTPSDCRSEPDVDAVESELARATPDNAQLLAWTTNPSSQPPREWWDDDSDPFMPNEGE